MVYDKAIVGGGLFGCYSAIRLADLGYSVVLIEQDRVVLNRASSVNQARLHTGLHYPRSYLTAVTSIKHFNSFREKFKESIFDFKQIYGISQHNSKTSAENFAQFVENLGIDTFELDPKDYFHASSVSAAFQVSEPTFDANILRRILFDQLNAHPKVSLYLDSKVIGCTYQDGSVSILLDSRNEIEAREVIISAYANTNRLRSLFDLESLPLSYELAEVILGKATDELHQTGVTIMDGPFWSLMPFGNTGLSSLTSVGLTPVRINTVEPKFDCQDLRRGCSSDSIADCQTCSVRPKSLVEHQIQQMKRHLKNAHKFIPTNSIMTVKTILKSTEIDDARPTLIVKDEFKPVLTIFSGKLSTIFDLDEELV